MSAGRATVLVTAVICGAIVALATIAAPRSCEGGLAAYAYGGVGALLVLLATPLVLRAGRPLDVALLRGLGLAVVGGTVWVAVFFAFPFRIVCRLF